MVPLYYELLMVHTYQTYTVAYVACGFVIILLQGTFLVSQAAVKQMMQDGCSNGSIVNISSIVGKVFINALL